jgi:hypothetical protein
MGFTNNFGQKESKLKNYKTSKLKVSENENISAEKAYILKILKATQILDVIQTLYLAYYWNGKKEGISLFVPHFYSNVPHFSCSPLYFSLCSPLYSAPN